jgi:hypothetical protein
VSVYERGFWGDVWDETFHANHPEGGCGFSWPLLDPNEEDQRNMIAHQCRREPDHQGRHKCACGEQA